MRSNRASLFIAMGRLEDAIASADRAIALRPDYAQAARNRGAALCALERFGEAVEAYDRAIALKPDFADAYADRALALAGLDRLDEALASADRAVALDPQLAAGYANRARVLVAGKRMAEALAAYDQAIELRPDVPHLHDDRAHVQFELERYPDALASTNRAIALRPDFAQAYANRALVLGKLRRFEDALADCDRAIALKPGFVEALVSRGDFLSQLDRPEEAIRSFEAAIALDPGHVNANANISQPLLSTGDFDRGWRQYEWRKRLKERFGDRSLPEPAWTGAEPIAGETILIHSEQGFGDALQFFRYVALVEARGASVVLWTQPALVPFLRQSAPAARVVAENELPGSYDRQVALMSLPLAFQTRLDTIPHAVPYLKADPERTAKWRARLGGQGFKVGICWQGSTKGADLGKSFPVANFEAVAGIASVRLVSLQKGEGAEQLQSLPAGMKVESFVDEMDLPGEAFLDTAAMIESLDLVITTDTSIAHLAGALARPVWVALKRAPDWRWGREGSDMPWYPTMRLFRQRVAGEWGSVFAEIAAALRGLVATQEGQPMRAQAMPSVPVSWGELIDKMTILEIKRAALAPGAALANVEKELAALEAVGAPALAEDAPLSALKDDLLAVNQALWTVEDDIREKERRSEFDSAFIELARSVYRLNDRRGAIKRAINVATASELVEEKLYRDYGAKT